MHRVLITFTLPLTLLLAGKFVAAAPAPTAADAITRADAALTLSPPDIDAAAAALDALQLPADAVWPADAWNAHLRLALARVARAPGDAILGVWEAQRAVLRYRTQHASLSPDTLHALDDTIDAIAGSSLSPRRLLTGVHDLPLDAASRRLVRYRDRHLDVLSRERQRQTLPRDTVQLGHARAVLDAQSVMLHATAEETAMRLASAVNAPGLPEPLADIGRRWQLLNTLDRFPLPADAAAELTQSLKDRNQRESVPTWNLCLRLLMRQVFAAPAAEKLGVWRAGLAELRGVGDGKALYAQTLADLDRFLMLTDAQRGVTGLEVLTDMLMLCPDGASMRQLSRRRTEHMLAMRDNVAAGRSVALELLLSLAADTVEYPQAVAYARSLAATRGVTVPALATFTPAALTRSNAAQAQPITFDKHLAHAAEGMLEVGDAFTERRRALLQLFAGRHDEALASAHRAVLWTNHLRVQGALENLGVALAAAHGDLRKYEVYAAFVAGVSDEFTRLTSPACREILEEEAGLRLELGEAEADAPLNLYGALPTAVRSELARRFLRALHERRLNWGAETMALGDLDLAASVWAQALAGASLAAADATLSARVAADLRRFGDTRLALDALERLRTRLADPRRQAFVRVVAAGFHYEQGQLAECVAELRRAAGPLQGVTHGQQLVAGLISAVCHIKLGDLQRAAVVLAALEDLPGDAEGRAQVLFLRGWIHLSANEEQPALVQLRRILDEHGGTSYAAKASELMRRLSSPDRGAGG